MAPTPATQNRPSDILPEIGYRLEPGAKAKEVRKTELTWTLKHTRRQWAEGAARHLINRAEANPTSPYLVSLERDRMAPYRDIVDYYIVARRKYPDAHRTITKKNPIEWSR